MATFSSQEDILKAEMCQLDDERTVHREEHKRLYQVMNQLQLGLLEISDKDEKQRLEKELDLKMKIAASMADKANAEAWQRAFEINKLRGDEGAEEWIQKRKVEILQLQSEIKAQQQQLESIMTRDEQEKEELIIMEHYKVYEQALQDGFELTLRYLKFLFLGPPRSGKTSTRRRLVHEIINLRSLYEPSVSTGVAEASDVIIKKLISASAAISNSKWWSLTENKSLSESDEINQVSKQELSYLARIFMLLTSKSATLNGIASSSSSTDPFDGLAPSDETDSCNTRKSDELPVKSSSQTSTNFLSYSEEMEIYNAFKELKAALQSDCSEDIQKHLEELTMINMVDIGGQPAFLEMLPALTVGPALYFIFFRLDQELKKYYDVRFHSANNKEETVLECSYCTETTLYQSLSSIACFGSYLPAESESRPHASSGAFLFGTFKDKVDSAHIKEMDKLLREKLKKTKLYQEDLILRTSNDDLFFAVDNMDGDDLEMSIVRKNIEDVINQFFRPVPIPVSWLIFRIILHFMNKPVVSLAQCKEIAKRLSMQSQVHEAIWFFHHNIGSLMHYPDINSMKDVVICNPQIIFDSVSELIIDTFKISNRAIPASAVDNFIEKGEFTLQHIKDTTKRQCNGYLSIEQLLDMLMHHNILSEIKYEQQESVASQFQQRFIIPAVLKCASQSELKPSHASISEHQSCPLMIHFDCGFVPFGIFCASVTHLIANQDYISPQWQLCNEKLMKNKVSFRIDRAYTVVLVCRPQYMEIHISRHSRARSKQSLANICSMVRQTMVKTLVSVISKMKYKPYAKIKTPLFPRKQPFDLAFTCNLEDSHADHLMKVINGDDDLSCECLKESVALDLDQEHLIWFGQHLQIVTREQSETHTASPDPVCLKPSDHSNIYCKLETHAFRWRDIGRALGFTENEMNLIESNHSLLRESPKSYLREMLSQWLEWGPGDLRGSKNYATRESLHAALLQANLAQLAANILKDIKV